MKKALSALAAGALMVGGTVFYATKNSNPPMATKSLQRDILLQFRYPDYHFPYQANWELQASSNLTTWWVYPTNKYKVFVVNGVTEVTVTNEYPRMFFRVRIF